MKFIVLLWVSSALFGTRAYAQVGAQSVYTSLKAQDCITVESDSFSTEEEWMIDFYKGVCPSYGGYILGVSGGDLRYSVFLSYHGVEIALPSFYQFHDAGEVAEWRYTLKRTGEFSNELHLSALIYRIYYDDYDSESDSDEGASALIVVRLNKEKSCVLGQIPKQKDMNVLARKLADDPNAKCQTIND